MSAEAKDAAQVAAERIRDELLDDAAVRAGWIAEEIRRAYAEHAPAVRELAGQASEDIYDWACKDWTDGQVLEIADIIARIFAPLEQQAELRAAAQEAVVWCDEQVAESIEHGKDSQIWQRRANHLEAALASQPEPEKYWKCPECGAEGNRHGPGCTQYPE